MDLNSARRSPVLADSMTASKPRLSLSSNIVQCSQTAAAAYSGAALCRTVSRRKTTGGGGPAEEARSGNLCLPQASQESDPAAAYQIWLMRYPSALASFYQITSQAWGKRIALFLDYDGTLSPIVNNPDCAFMSAEMRSAVKNVAGHFPTAIISGRSRDKVSEFVQLTELYYAGSHGMDIMGPPGKPESAAGHPNCIRTTDCQGKEVTLFQPASEFLPTIDEVFRYLVEISEDFRGSKVESNKFCLSIHYRMVVSKAWEALEERVKDMLLGYPLMRLTYGRKVLEIRPDIDWDKGKAVEFLLESLGLDDADDVLPIYIGDDRTDEDAFKVLREGNKGFGIVVSNKPKASQAFYSLRDTSEVKAFLENLVTWQSTERP